MDDPTEATTRWFRELPAGHPVVQVLFELAVARLRARQTRRPEPRK